MVTRICSMSMSNVKVLAPHPRGIRHFQSRAFVKGMCKMNLSRARSTRHFVSASTLLLALLLPGAQLYAQGGAGGAANALPSGEGRDIVAMMCSQCHALRMVTVLRDGPLGWKKTVDEMVLRGAQIDAQQAQTVIQYLS